MYINNDRMYISTLKNTWYLILIALAAGSCGTLRPAKRAPAENTDQKKMHSVDPGNFSTSGRESRKGNDITGFSGDPNITAHYPALFSGSIENINILQFKYAISLNIPVEALLNGNLLSYIDEWYGTRYRYGGAGKNGIDCSAFTAGLLSSVYQVRIPRTVKEQYENSDPVLRDVLQEGDLVFFNTGKRLSHVGIYLVNNKFVHASTTSGVMISDLNEDYFRTRYAGARRARRP